METSLFNHSPQKSLAELLRPKNLDEFTGQEEILGPGKTLRTLIEKDKILPYFLRPSGDRENHIGTNCLPDDPV